MRHIHLTETDSTNSYLVRNAGELESPVMVTAGCQTAGRGQRGNSWESDTDANLLCSVMWCPENFPAISQFSISEAVALSIVAALHDTAGIEAKVKWPNDIYVGDKKIAGILIENALARKSLVRTVIGAGINLNQKEFRSDAPNPVSVYNLTGRPVDIEEFRLSFVAHLKSGFELSLEESGRHRLHEEFMRQLWRGGDEAAPYRDVASGESFMAVIDHIEPTGHLVLRETVPTTGRLRRYAFKEVEAVIQPQKEN